MRRRRPSSGGETRQRQGTNVSINAVSKRVGRLEEKFRAATAAMQVLDRASPLEKIRSGSPRRQWNKPQVRAWHTRLHALWE